MALRPREAALLVLVTSVLVMGAVNGLPWVPFWTEPPDTGPGELIELSDADGAPAIWPYVAAGPTFDHPTSPINVVFEADPDRVQRIFVRSLDDVNVTSGGEPRHPPGADWRVLESAKRYVYLAPAKGADGEWRAPAYQLHQGSYFGTQSHLRVYDASVGDERWTVVQAHSEHWDWFAMTHRVDSVERPREEIETVLFRDPSVSDVRRVYFGNRATFDADGWTTVVSLATLFVISGATLIPRRPEDRRRLALLLGIAAVPLAVRAAGVLVGDAGVSPDLLSRSLYPVYVLGLPLVAVGGGRRVRPWEAFTLATAGFAAAIVLDYTFLEVGVLQLELIVHRSLAAVAVGLLAAGAAILDEDANLDPRLVAGGVLWLVVLVVPHVRF